MMKREVKEIYLLRFVACLGIVLMHSVTLALNMYNIEEGPQFVILTSIQLIFMFGTPLLYLSQSLSLPFPIQIVCRKVLCKTL